MWCTWVRYHVADVRHARYKQDQSFKSETETTMWTASVSASIKIPPHIFHRNVTTLDFIHQFVVVLFTNTTTNDFSNSRVPDA